MKLRDIRMGLTVVTEPAFEPVSRAEAKAQCEIDHNDWDTLIDGWIAVARRKVEQDTGRVLVNTVLKQTIDAFPEERYIPFLRWPLKSIASIVSYDDDDASSTLASSKYFADTVKHRVYLNDGESWPSDLRNFNAGELQFTAGNNGDPVTVSAISASGSAPDITATVTATAHGFLTGDRITIVGAAQGAYNGTFVITKVDADSFTYPISRGSPAAATGTITARKLNAPSSHQLAILLLVEHYAKNRGAVERIAAGESVQELPLGYAALVGGADRQFAMA